MILIQVEEYKHYLNEENNRFIYRLDAHRVNYLQSGCYFWCWLGFVSHPDIRSLFGPARHLVSFWSRHMLGPSYMKNAHIIQSLDIFLLYKLAIQLHRIYNDNTQSKNCISLNFQQNLNARLGTIKIFDSSHFKVEKNLP